jgi:hypothetical protein
MQTLSSVTNVLELEHKATARIGWAVSTDSWTADDPIAAMRARGHGRYLPTALSTKAAVSPITTADTAVALLPLDAAFLGLVDYQSLLGKLPGAVRLSIRTSARLQTSLVPGAFVAETALKPVSAVNFAEPGAPVKVVSQLVVSAEVLRAVDAATQDGLRQVLVSAVAEGTDAALLAALTAGAPAGSATPGALLAAIANGAPRAPVLIGGYDALLALDAGLIRDLQALGVLVLASNAATGTLVTLDQSGLLIAADEIRVDVARHADVVLDDLNPPGGATTINLWQTNTRAIKAERLLKIGVRPDAAAWASVGTP